MVRLLIKFQKNRTKTFEDNGVLVTSRSAVLYPKTAYVWKIVEKQVFKQFANDKSKDTDKASLQNEYLILEILEFRTKFKKTCFLKKKTKKNLIWNFIKRPEYLW